MIKKAKLFTPGVFLSEEMKARGWTAEDLEKKSHIQAVAIREIISGYRKITPIFALGLGQAFGTSPDLWENLQDSYDNRA